jgi:hypothetical protein
MTLFDLKGGAYVSLRSTRLSPVVLRVTIITLGYLYIAFVSWLVGKSIGLSAQ